MIFLKLSDAQIRPMPLYGSEIWSLDKQKAIESVHTFGSKRLPNVSPRILNNMVYGETGQHPLHVIDIPLQPASSTGFYG